MSPRNTNTESEAVISDDAERQPLKEVSADRASIPRNRPSQRTGRAALSVPDGAKQPADRQDSQAELDAQRREALDDDGLVTVEYNGVEFTFDPLSFDIEFQLLAERGLPARALVGVIGDEQIKAIFRWPATELENLIQALAKGAGLGNS